MARCEVCGNDYDKSFEILRAGKSHIFDSFECAIHALAPTCKHCGCRIIGHGMEAQGGIFLLRVLREARGRAANEGSGRVDHAALARYYTCCTCASR
jgi:hypothetical protein